MVPIFATSTQANLLIYVGGGGFILLGAFFFGRLVSFFFPKNPLIRKGKEENDAWCEIKFWIRWCRDEIQDHWNLSDFWLKRHCFYLVFFLLGSYLKRIMMEEWTSLITGPGFLLWLLFLRLEKLRSLVESSPIWLLLVCFLGRLDTLLQQARWLRCSAGKARNKAITRKLILRRSRWDPSLIYPLKKTGW